jgi:hypothetical protein
VTISASGGTLVGGGDRDGMSKLDPTTFHISEEDDMTGHTHDSSAHRGSDHSWVLTAWVLPLAVAGGITVLTAGFGALIIVVAIMIGLIATALHRWGPSE